jgi:hypothetical protein
MVGILLCWLADGDAGIHIVVHRFVPVPDPLYPRRSPQSGQLGTPKYAA